MGLVSVNVVAFQSNSLNYVAQELFAPVFHIFFKVQLCRLHRVGQGFNKYSSDPENHEPGEVDRVMPKLRRAPSPKGPQIDGKHHSGSTSTSMTPPAGILPRPTLFTSRESTSPRPPVAGAAAGGRVNPDSSASEVA
jgi:hypothetical protein